MASPTRRHPLEIFDVTIRDGSYTIDFQFNQEDVRFLYPVLEKIGFRYIEVGHGFGLNASSVKGLAAATDEEYLSAAADARTSSRFGTFFIPSIGEKEHMRAAREDFGMDFIRIGSDADKIESTLEYVEYAKSLGYEVMSNFMKTYAISPAEFARKAKALAEKGVDVVYLVDSAGGMLPDEVGEYVKAVADEADVRIGFHAHNNLELAGANALSAWQNGCTLVDCSIGGLGRSAGNTRTELFIPIMRQLGVQFDYDFIEVLRVWQEFILPIQHRRKPTSRAVATGYARVHSGLIAPFVEASAKHGIEIEAILEAFGDALYSGNATLSVEEAVKRVGQTRKTPPSHSESVLLKIGPSHGDPASIRNTFHSVDEVLNAVNALSKKAYLPVALVVSIEAVAPDEPYVAAEYLYHDEHFIVIHAMFSSVSLFVEVKRKYRGRFEILVFDRLSPSGLSALEARRSDWRQGERVVHLDSRICKYHYLFSILYQIATDTDAKTVLLFAGDPERVRSHAPPEIRQLKLFCACQKRDSLTGVGIFPLDLSEAGQIQEAAAAHVTFDIVVILSAVDATEMEAIVGRMSRHGALIDCAAQTSRHEEMLDGIPQRIVTVNPWRALTGELLSLSSIGSDQGD